MSESALGQITSDEIASQPACWLLAQDQARAGVPGLPASGERVLVLGCGTSYYVGARTRGCASRAGTGRPTR